MANGRKALVLGGTEFLGIHLVESLIAENWEVTLFNRGHTQPDYFGSLVQLRGDRDGDVSALEGGVWDVVFDLSAYHPSQVERSAVYLREHCGHYVFVSSISAYEGLPRAGTTEDAPLAGIDGELPSEVDGASYGPLKALCEARVADLFESWTVIRPTVIVGPHDPSDRFTYWVVRLSEAGQHVVPPTLDASVQYIDVRDLATWMVQLALKPVNGALNAAVDHVTFGHFARVITDVAGVKLRPVQLTEEQMTMEAVRPWVDLPMWLPPTDLDMRGFFQVDASRAVGTGLRTRSLESTVRDTLEWFRGRVADGLQVGLSKEREAELVARYGIAD